MNPSGGPAAIPAVGMPLQDLGLIDAEGAPFDVSGLRGRVTLIEFASMSCAACIAFSGGHERGGFAGKNPQAGLESIDEIFSRATGGLSLDDDRIAFVQVFLFDEQDRTPSPESLSRWNNHFGLSSANNIRLVGSNRLFGSRTRSMVPSFLLVDREGTIAAETIGDPAALYTKLLPKVSRLL